MPLTEEKLAELETKHKRIAHLKGKGDPTPWEIVLRKPSRADYKIFRAQSHNPAQVADAQEILARKCCVWPEGNAFDALLEDYPGIPEASSGAIKNLLGLEVAEDLK